MKMNKKVYFSENYDSTSQFKENDKFCEGNEFAGSGLLGYSDLEIFFLIEV